MAFLIVKMCSECQMPVLLESKFLISENMVSMWTVFWCPCQPISYRFLTDLDTNVSQMTSEGTF